MKNPFIFVFILMGIGIANGNNFITAQYPDLIKFKGKQYNLNSNPLEPFFEKYPDKRPQGGIMSTALWRGYVAEFEIFDEQLMLTDIKIQVYDEASEDEYDIKWVSAYHQVFPNSKRIKIDWYTGILILPYGKLVDYVHMGYASTYSKYWLLEIYNGEFKEARNYNSKEFTEFKKSQFEVFEKTDEYKKLYSELKQDDTKRDDEFLKSFIADFIINYTSEFLTD